MLLRFEVPGRPKRLGGEQASRATAAPSAAYL